MFKKILKFIANGGTVSSFELLLLIIGIAVAFLISLVTIRFLMDFVKRHSFSPFGVYRIILGVGVISFFLIR